MRILNAVTSATIIATDTKESALRQAEKYGATTVPSGDGQVDAIWALTGGRGVDVVFDMVGVGPTMQTAIASVATQGRVSVVGLGSVGSDYGWQWYKEPCEAELVKTYWGTLPELGELVAYQQLLDGQVSGRAIIVPRSRVPYDARSAHHRCRYSNA